MGCPATDCTAAEPGQRELTASQREVIGNPPWAGEGQRCSYCGCVYSHGKRGRRTVRGWYDNSLLDGGWLPKGDA